ncbi:MAG: VTT domain-containing protein [Candidatus Saccharimonadales bacterium]
MEALLNLITNLGWIAVLCVIFAESGLLIGFFLPGDSLLFTAGFLVQQGFFSINIHLFVLLLFIAASLGQSTGYVFGNKVGRKLFDRENTRFFRKENLIRAELFYEKYGPVTIILACFIPFVRTFVPIVAGISKMKYREFIVYNIIGAAIWTASFTYLGYYAGKVLHDMGINVEIAALIIIALSISPMIIHILKDSKRRHAIIEGTKRELKIVFSRRKKL